MRAVDIESLLGSVVAGEADLKRLAAVARLTDAKLRSILARRPGTDTRGLCLDRDAFSAEGEHLVDICRRKGRSSAVLHIDCGGPAAETNFATPVAKLLRDTSRANDLVAQIAPVVFSVWLCEVSEPGALTRAERLIAAASRLPYDDMPRLTIGVAVFDPVSDETIDDLMDRAADAAFVARRLGAGRAQLAETTAEVREALAAFV